MESGFQDEPWTFRTLGDVLQTHELAHDLSDDDEQDLH